MANKALLVGINKYQISGANLAGCVNDISNMRKTLLAYFGYKAEEINTLTDEQATKKNIIEGLEQLVNGVKKGDRLLFHFSGHGSQVPDQSGDEGKDAMDEIICPHDMDWDGTFIMDDDLKNILSALPYGCTLEVFLDSCHSGTATKNGAAHFRSSQADSFRTRFISPPQDLSGDRNQECLVKRVIKSQTSRSKRSGTIILFAACRDRQTAAEDYLGGSYNGAFTYHLTHLLRDTQGNITRAELLKKIKKTLKLDGFGQIPQLESPASRKKKRILE